MAYQGVPFELERHLERLDGSAQRIAMNLPVPLAQFGAEICEAHAASGNHTCPLQALTWAIR